MKSLLVVCIILSAGALASVIGASVSAASGSDPAFAKFVDDYFDAKFANQPAQGTAAGFHQYDSKQQDLSRPAIEKRIAELKSLLARLQSLDRSKFSFDDGIDAAAIEGEIRSDLLDLETLRVWERNPMLYVLVSAFSINDLMKR